MFWLQRRRFHSFIVNSLWVFPACCMIASIFLAPLIRDWNTALQLPFLDFGLNGARTAAGVIAASMLSFVVFFFSVLLLTVQIAGGTLSPRIIARPFQSRVLKISLGLFVFSFVYSVEVLGRLEDHVHQLPVFLTIVLSIASIGTFLFVVEYESKQLRPVAVVASVGREGLQVIRSIYPHRRPGAVRSPSRLFPGSGVHRTIPYCGTPGVVVAVDLDGLASLAVKHDCLIELVPQVGDFMPVGTPLFHIYAGDGHISATDLHHAIQLGRERILEQDPAFAFRIIVDIAEKALSPSVNDPTTAVLAIDQLQCLLQELGERDLSAGTVLDGNGQLRVLYRTPNWEDFVSLAVSEIRQYGRNSIQVARRLCGMLTSLIAVLPPSRASCLQEQLDLLHHAIEKAFDDPWDRIQAAVPDSQGLGAALTSANGTPRI